MITAALVGLLCSVAALFVLLPVVRRSRVQVLTMPDVSADDGRALLRQLRDLDDDLAAGKIGESDHRRLRAPLARRAASVLAEADGEGRKDPRAGGSRTGSSRRADASRRARLLVVALALVVGVASVVGVSILLGDAVAPRATSPQSLSGEGNAAQGGPPASGQVPGQAGEVSAEQVARVEQGVAQVTKKPKSVAAHLYLARAYAEVGQRPLAAIEYLAVDRLDPGNPEANTSLALFAFTGGKIGQAERLVKKVLEVHPRQPEALYAQGIIALMGRNNPQEARASFEAYLDAAPFGSHREAVDTFLQIIDGKPAQ